MRSFDENGRERFIEVKTTAWGKETPFFISRNELEFANAFPEQFHLYRVFEFRKSPHLCDMPGVVERNCLLDPVSYVGRFSYICVARAHNHRGCAGPGRLFSVDPGWNEM